MATHVTIRGKAPNFSKSATGVVRDPAGGGSFFTYAEPKSTAARKTADRRCASRRRARRAARRAG